MASASNIWQAHPQDPNLYLCTICKRANPANPALTNKYLARTSRRGHEHSVVHLNSIRICSESDRLARERQAQYDNLQQTHAPLASLAPQPKSSDAAETHQQYPSFDPTLSGASVEVDSSWQPSPAEEAALFPPTKTAAEIEEDHRTLLRQEFELLHLQSLEADFEFEDDPWLADESDNIRHFDLGGDRDDEDITAILSRLSKRSNWTPYPSKTFALLDIVDNLPRLRLSSSQLKIILWLLRESGVQDVPSYKGLRDLQEQLRKDCAISTDKQKSDIGNVFFTNDICDILAQDLSNPQIAPHIQKYPEIVENGPVSEFWQMPEGKWRELPIDELAPSIVVLDKRFYIHEVAELDDGQWLIPRMWVDVRRTQGVVTHVEGRLVEQGPDGLLRVALELVRLPVGRLATTQDELEQRLKRRLIFAPDAEEFASRIPNKHRAIDNGEDLLTLWVQLWGDDVSGARTKQYQKHINIYSANANLPGKFLQQECNVHFVSTSQTASVLEQIAPTLQKIKSTHRSPHRCFDASTQRGCGIRVNVPDCAADNPQQSEECSHIGHQGLYPCRACKIGGSKATTESPEGYHAYYEIGALREVNEIRACVLEQIRLASYGVIGHVETLQTQTGVKDKIAQTWIEWLIPQARDKHRLNPLKPREEISRELLSSLATRTTQPYNPLLDVDFLDPSQDTMVEILHTILLGIEKYSWYGLHHDWTPAQRDLFATRLASTSIDGMNGPPIRADYFLQYRNNLIGRQLKTLMQASAFHVHGLVSDCQFVLVKAVGELGATLWITEIDDLDGYLDQLQIFIDNVLEAFSLVDPAKITVKIKLHMLVHLVPNIRRRGPAVRFSTEVFECYNAVFRYCSIFSNHQAPSRDIALKLANLERVKHLLCGGFWRSAEYARWETGGGDLRALLSKHSLLQRHIGWVPAPTFEPGLCKPVSKQNQQPMPFSKSASYKATLPSTDISPSSLWVYGCSSICTNGDRAGVGSWVVYELDRSCSAVIGGTTRIGRVNEILVPLGAAASTSGIICIDVYEVSGQRHPELAMPVLQQLNATTARIPSQALRFLVNVQHDCRTFGCAPTATRHKVMEREVTDIEIAVIEHTPNTNRFIINTHNIHNKHLLNRVLPCSLTDAIPLFRDSRARHHAMADNLHTHMVTKRAATQAKAAATRQKKKDARAAGDQDAEVAEGDEGHESVDAGIVEGDEDDQGPEKDGASSSTSIQRKRKR